MLDMPCRNIEIIPTIPPTPVRAGFGTVGMIIIAGLAIGAIYYITKKK